MLRRSDLREAITVLGAVAESARDVSSFAAAGVRLLPALVASEMTTLSLCDLESGRREVVASPGGRISAADRAAFDRYFAVHPLVRYHAGARGRDAHRISDTMPFARFRHSALFADYYRRVGIDHAIALPLFVDARTLVSFVLNRKGRDFSDRDRDVLDLTGATLAGMFSTFRAADRAARRGLGPVLTPREHEVLRWLAAGKTDRDVAAILGCSHRTVQKHLEHVYEKLGVETRTAAVMRWLDLAPH